MKFLNFQKFEKPQSEIVESSILAP